MAWHILPAPFRHPSVGVMGLTDIAVDNSDDPHTTTLENVLNLVVVLQKNNCAQGSWVKQTQRTELYSKFAPYIYKKTHAPESLISHNFVHSA